MWPAHRTAHRHQRAWLSAFESVQAYSRRRLDRNTYVLLSHFPYRGDHTEDERYAEYRLHDTGMWLVHGHVHDAWAQRGRQINVGVDVRNWSPISLAELTEIVRSGEVDR